mmetsp:Transcript_19482/g.74763  ORF Transcript_19482/g.74763 Transcript_19482/m.74763 type:complete len:155 (-) Transcript_19482:508-972(-)
MAIPVHSQPPGTFLCEVASSLSIRILDVPPFRRNAAKQGVNMAHTVTLHCNVESCHLLVPNPSQQQIHWRGLHELLVDPQRRWFLRFPPMDCSTICLSFQSSAPGQAIKEQLCCLPSSVPDCNVEQRNATGIPGSQQFLVGDSASNRGEALAAE